MSLLLQRRTRQVLSRACILSRTNSTASASLGEVSEYSLASTSASGKSTPSRARKSPRAIRLQRASERRVLPQYEHISEFADLSKPDPLLDTKAVTHIPATPKHPYSSTLIEYAPYFGISSQKDLPKSNENHDAEPKEEEPFDAIKAEREAREARLPYPPSIIKNLHRYPLVLKRVVQQTPKGRIPSYYALVVVGTGDGVMGIGEGKDVENGSGAQSKAYADAIKGLDTVSRYEDRTIHTEAYMKFGATQIRMWPRPAGFGLSVNPYIHQICKAAGIRDLTAKVIGSKNPMQVVKTTMMMLHGGSSPSSFGNGIGGKGRRLEAKQGLRSKEVIERERGRRLIEGSGWL